MPAAAVVRELRLPRAMAAFAVGALLALAGTMMQVLLRNPLADPYVLGLSGGAACGALTALLVGAAALVTPAAFAGAAGFDRCRVRLGARQGRVGADPAAADRRRRRGGMGRTHHAATHHRSRSPGPRDAVLARSATFRVPTRGGPALAGTRDCARRRHARSHATPRCSRAAT